MKKIYLFIITFIIIISLALILFWRQSPKSLPATADLKSVNRIVSLSPSTTETLFALGLGHKLVGVTRFCNFPSETQKLPRVGGYLDLNYEALVALKPDLVIILPEFEQVKNYLTELNIQYLVVNNKTIHDIIQTIQTLGQVGGVQKIADALVLKLQARMQTIKIMTVPLPHPEVLISIGRTVGSGTLEEVYIAGKNTLYNEMIELAGGKNTYHDSLQAYPMVSAEGILQMNPDIIIDLVTDLNEKKLTEQQILKEWNSIASIQAAQNHRIHILSDDFAVIPGPRFILFLEKLVKIIHPELEAI
ncbi:ABC transporter substrate-binding protein [candidate division KSB1 bacterium]|nr:ABC transporter substrate-binding protein [candidate division KSB1 bacterium]